MAEYMERSYRALMDARDSRGDSRFRSFMVAHLETDLWIGVDPPSYDPAMELFVLERARAYRSELEAYGAACPEFLSSFSPVPYDPEAPGIARAMMRECVAANVGPMAAVAGAFAFFAGRDLERAFALRELVVENGGDMYLRFVSPLEVAVFAGESPLSGKVGVTIPAGMSPLGVCTSSGTVGPSYSYGKADAAMVCCRNPARADAWATALGNRVKGADDIEPALALPFSDPEVVSALVVKGDRMGIRGGLELKLFR